MLLFSVGNGACSDIGNGAMNSSAILATTQWTSLRYWQLRNELPRDIGNCGMNSPMILETARWCL
jgi:hypothetical protein